MDKRAGKIVQTKADPRLPGRQAPSAGNKDDEVLQNTSSNVLLPLEEKILMEVREMKLVPEELLNESVSKYKGDKDSLESVLESIGVSGDDILKIKEKITGLPAVSKKEIESITANVLKEIPEEAARQYKIVPLGSDKNIIKIGMLNPDDYTAKEAVRFITLSNNKNLELYVISYELYKQVLNQYRTSRSQIKEALEEFEKEAVEGAKKRPKKEEEEASEIVKEAPITKVVAVILKHAVEGKASDIHIEPTMERTQVRFRVDGKLHASLLLPAKIHAAIVSRIKVVSNLRIDEMRIPQDGRFATDISGRTIDFRVSTFPTRLGEKVVLRVLDSSLSIKEFEDLGIWGRNADIMRQAITKPYGMILVSGPTGSGKSTTLYASLSAVDRDIYNVVSLEDPIEYSIDKVNQSQVKQEIGYTFASGLRHILRQDPDIIMVGEIRDTETAQLAVHASLTGHLVFSTIHTNNAMGVIPRLIDMGVDQFLIPSSVELAAAQRLVRKLCPYCKFKEKAPEKMSALIKKELSDLRKDVLERFEVTIQDSYEIWNAKGCDRCARKGAVGRVAIFEMFSMTKELKEIVYKDPNEITIGAEVKRQGMSTLLQDGIIKALRGLVSMEEVLRVVEES